MDTTPTVQDLALVAALGLGVAFVWAAVAKMRDRSATAAAFVGLRVPRPGLAVRVVPGIELIVAALLVVWPVAGAFSALTLLAFFTTFLASRLREGVRVSCGCFGGSADQPLSWVHVARNVLLSLAALLATDADGPALPTIGAVAVGMGVTTAAIGALHLAARFVAAPSGSDRRANPAPGP